MRKPLKLIAAALFFGLFLSACWDMQDIENQNIVTAVIVDKTETGYALYIEVAAIGATAQGQEGAQQSPQNIIIRGEGETYESARKDLENKSNKTLFIGGVQSLIFTEKVAEESIAEYIFRVRHEPLYRKTLRVFVLKGDPMEVLRSSNENNPLIGLAVNENITSLYESGYALDVNVLDILAGLSCPNKSLVIPTLEMIEDNVGTTGYTVFDNGKAKGFIPAEDAVGLLALTARKFKTTQTLRLRDVDFTVELKRTKKKIKSNREGGGAAFKIEVAFKAFLMYPSRKINVTAEIQSELKALLEEKMKESIIKEIIRATKTYETDYLDLYDVFRIKNAPYCREIDWKEIFPDIKYEASVKVDMKMNERIEYSQGGS
ncbi:MAG: Ger(x)C family spore germination protein [Bacillota bacterium]|jgi:Ger(x)C family germination protein|nr:Ger(x)C family spore germination protein [Bacillota bacterium]